VLDSLVDLGGDALVRPALAAGVKVLDAAEEAGDRLAALWTVAGLTGARQGELLGLKWSDLDLDGGTMRIDRSLTAIEKARESPSSASPRRQRVGAVCHSSPRPPPP
jgi:integrase